MKEKNVFLSVFVRRSNQRFPSIGSALTRCCNVDQLNDTVQIVFGHFGFFEKSNGFVCFHFVVLHQFVVKRCVTTCGDNGNEKNKNNNQKNQSESTQAKESIRKHTGKQMGKQMGKQKRGTSVGTYFGLSGRCPMTRTPAVAVAAVPVPPVLPEDQLHDGRSFLVLLDVLVRLVVLVLLVLFVVVLLVPPLLPRILLRRLLR